VISIDNDGYAYAQSKSGPQTFNPRRFASRRNRQREQVNEPLRGHPMEACVNAG
jgi:hypothetical protein